MDQLIVVAVVGIIALVKWLVENSGKFQSGGEAGNDVPSSPVDRPAPRRPARPYGSPADPAARAETDEEKMRRFMEALGLPGNAVPPPPSQRPAASKAYPPSNPQPAPKPHPRQLGRPLPAPVLPRRAPAQPVAPQTPPEPVRHTIAAPLDTGGPLPQIPKSRPMSESAPAVQVTSFAPAAVAAAGASITPAQQQTSSSQPTPAADLRASLRGQLGSPEALRRAILLREILGEPKGLQSMDSPSIFSPL